jgi:hypothetical protein
VDDFEEMLNAFKESCRRAVQSEVDSGVVLDNMTRKEKKVWKNRVLSGIMKDFPYLAIQMKKWTDYISRSGLNGVKVKPTQEEELGHRVTGIWGNACQYYQPNDNTPLEVLPQHNDSIAARYRQLCAEAAKEGFLIPADSILATMCNCTAGAFSITRRKMKRNGWVFRCVEYPGTVWRAYFVTAPPEPEPEETPLLSDDERLLLQQV